MMPHTLRCQCISLTYMFGHIRLVKSSSLAVRRWGEQWRRGREGRAAVARAAIAGQAVTLRDIY